jgi:hypothetical protein
MRGKGVHIAGKLVYRQDLIAVWRANPRATMDEARKLTGAPQSVVDKVRRDLVTAGLLKVGPDKW